MFNRRFCFQAPSSFCSRRFVAASSNLINSARFCSSFSSTPLNKDSISHKSLFGVKLDPKKDLIDIEVFNSTFPRGKEPLISKGPAVVELFSTKQAADTILYNLDHAQTDADVELWASFIETITYQNQKAVQHFANQEAADVLVRALRRTPAESSFYTLGTVVHACKIAAHFFTANEDKVIVQNAVVEYLMTAGVVPALMDSLVGLTKQGAAMVLESMAPEEEQQQSEGESNNANKSKEEVEKMKHDFLTTLGEVGSFLYTLLSSDATSVSKILAAPFSTENTNAKNLYAKAFFDGFRLAFIYGRLEIVGIYGAVLGRMLDDPSIDPSLLQVYITPATITLLTEQFVQVNVGIENQKRMNQQQQQDNQAQQENATALVGFMQRVSQDLCILLSSATQKLEGLSPEEKNALLWSKKNEKSLVSALTNVIMFVDGQIAATTSYEEMEQEQRSLFESIKLLSSFVEAAATADAATVSPDQVALLESKTLGRALVNAFVNAQNPATKMMSAYAITLNMSYLVSNSDPESAEAHKKLGALLRENFFDQPHFATSTIQSLAIANNEEDSLQFTSLVYHANRFGARSNVYATPEILNDTWLPIFNQVLSNSDAEGLRYRKSIFLILSELLILNPKAQLTVCKSKNWFKAIAESAGVDRFKSNLEKYHFLIFLCSLRISSSSATENAEGYKMPQANDSYGLNDEAIAEFRKHFEDPECGEAKKNIVETLMSLKEFYGKESKIESSEEENYDHEEAKLRFEEVCDLCQC